MKRNDVTVYISLGSNIGDRAFYLQAAIKQLHTHECIVVAKKSSIYETEPIGYVEQEPFLNMVIELHTSLTPEQLLIETQKIETKYGRQRDEKWGPRTLDLDILLYGEEKIQTNDLIVPHPRMWERAFVVIPLMELNCTLHTETGNTIQDVYNKLHDKQKVVLWKEVKQFN